MKLNPANYTAWHFRRECLKRLDGYQTNSAAVQQELDLAAALGGSNPKNYQVCRDMQYSTFTVGHILSNFLDSY